MRKSSPNQILLVDGHAEIVILRKGVEVTRALIDIDDIILVQNKYWSYYLNGYVSAKVNGKTTSLHKLIFGSKKGYDLDHINRNKLDNRKSNLRFLTRSQNQLNRSNPLRGVTWYEKQRIWTAHIMKDRKKIYLGTYGFLQEALDARREAEIQLFPEIFSRAYCRKEK